MSTKELVERIDALYAKATPGEWSVEHDYVLTKGGGGKGDPSQELFAGDINIARSSIYSRLVDFDLIAALVNAWPEIRELLAKGDGAQGVVVPREPTPEMIAAAMPTAFIGHPETSEESKARWFKSHRLSLIEKYKAMIAAAPPVERDDSKGENT